MAKKDIIKKKKGETIHEAKLDNNGLQKENIMKIVLAALVLCVVLFSILFS